MRRRPGSADHRDRDPGGVPEDSTTATSVLSSVSPRWSQWRADDVPGWVRPLSPVQPVSAVVWRPWTVALVAVAVGLAGWRIACWMSPSVWGPEIVLDGLGVWSGPRWVLARLVDVGVASAVLACVVAAGGRGAVGWSSRPRLPETMAAVGYAVSRPLPLMTLTTLVTLVTTPWVWQPGPLELPPVREVLLRGAAAGVAEEILATVLVYWLLEQVRGPHRIALAHSGVGTVLIVALHAVYHLHLGWTLIGALPVLHTMVLLWRHYKSLPVLIAAHAGLDCVASWIDDPLLAAGVTGLVVHLVAKPVALMLAGQVLERRALLAVYSDRRPGRDTTGC